MDIGGGSGRISVLLNSFGYKNTYLIDPSKVHINGAKKLSLSAECVDFYKFHAKKKYDVVIANEVLEFIQLEDLVSFANKYLFKNGIIIFVYLNNNSFRQKIKTFLHPEKKSKSCYVEQEILNLLMYENGFTLIKNYGFMWHYLVVFQIIFLSMYSLFSKKYSC